jgi:hypothetical protein
MAKELSMKQAVQIIQSREQINEPCKRRVRVTGTTPFIREDGTAVTIVNLAAMTSYHVAQAKAFLKEGKLQEATNQNLTSSPRQGRDFTPTKGQIVDIIVGYVETKSGEQALLVTNMTDVPLSQSTSVKGFESFLAENVEAPAVFAQEGVEA